MEENVENQDHLITAQKEKIEADIASATPLISDRLPIAQLDADFAADPVYRAKVAKIAETYGEFRRTRPDGNCFFRAIGFRLFEALLGDSAAWATVRERLQGSKAEMVGLGMPEFTVEDFFDNFMDNLERVGGEGLEGASLAEVEEMFREEGSSNYLVVFLRLLTSKQLQLEGEFYQNFMEGGATVSSFCSQEVEPMYKESDHIHIIALTAAAGLAVRVVYLDRGEGAAPTSHDFPEGAAPSLHLLYRPGHYDILYPK